MEFLILICVPRPSSVHIFLKSLSYANADFSFLEDLGQNAVDALPFDMSELTSAGPLTHCFEDGNIESQSFLLNYKAKIVLLAAYFVVLTPLFVVAGCICQAGNW